MYIRAVRVRKYEFALPRRWLAILTISLAALAGCGGGGTSGGSGGSGGTAPPPPVSGVSPVPTDPPRPPTVTYAGLTDPVEVNAESCGSAAELAYVALFEARGLTDFVTNQPVAHGVHDRTIDGPVGGTAHLQGRIASDGTGWFSIDYLDFDNGDLVVNGAEVTNILGTVGSGAFETIRIDWHNLRIEGGGFNQRLHGSLSCQFDSVEGCGQSELNVLFTDLQTNAALKLENVRVHHDLNDVFKNTYEFSGRVYDSGFGFLDTSTTTPLVFDTFDAAGPFKGGPWIASGRGGVWLESLSHVYASLQLVPVGGTSPDRALRVSWDTPFFLQVALPGNGRPVAIGGADSVVVAGERQELDGRMSHHPDGRLERFRWTMLFAPPGSTAVIERPNSFQPAFEPDLTGSYLVMLEVDDGIHATYDITSYLVESVGLPRRPEVRFALPPDRVVRVGERVTLDGTMVWPLQEDIPTEFRYSWSAGQIPLEDADGPTPSVVFDEPGIYVVSAELDPDATDQQIFAVGGNLPPIPAIASTPSYALENDIAVADVTGDGIEDLVLSHLGNYQTDLIPRLHIYAGNPGGGFSAPVSYEGGAGGDVEILDIGSDIPPGLATVASGGIELFRQSDQHAFLSAGFLTQSEFGCSTARSLYRSLSPGDFNADGRTDLVVQNPCRQHMEAFFQLEDGSFGAPVLMQPDPDGIFMTLRVADLNGDGVDDVLAVSPPQTTNDKGKLIIARGSPAGLEAPEVVAEIGDIFGNPTVDVADINRDGRTDAIVGTGRSFLVYLQDDNGWLVVQQAVDAVASERFFAIVDVDRDGLVDIYAADSHSPLIYRQLENGEFSTGVNIPLILNTNTVPRYDNTDPLAIGDVNGDGTAEIISVNNGHLGFLFARPVQPEDDADQSSKAEELPPAVAATSLIEDRTPLSFSRWRITRSRDFDGSPSFTQERQQAGQLEER